MKLSDACSLPRFGIKGRAAAGWLTAQGIVLPQQANTWSLLSDDTRALRLGRGEFLLEGAAVPGLEAAWQDGQRDIYRVPRYDGAFVMSGENMHFVLQEICALDTRPEVTADAVLMTMVAGISAILICEAGNDAPVYRLWCDGTYADYLREVLMEIVVEHGGAIV